MRRIPAILNKMSLLNSIHHLFNRILDQSNNCHLMILRNHLLLNNKLIDLVKLYIINNNSNNQLLPSNNNQDHLFKITRTIKIIKYHLNKTIIIMFNNPSRLPNQSSNRIHNNLKDSQALTPFRTIIFLNSNNNIITNHLKSINPPSNNLFSKDPKHSRLKHLNCTSLLLRS
jgi:hypothetical protein